MFRTANGYTSQVVADVLGIGRAAYANYEAGDREMPLRLLEKAADFFGCELDTLLSDEAVEEDALLCAFRVDNLSTSDAEQVMQFKSVVKNYLKMRNMMCYA